MGGAADAEADGRETGFRTAFHGGDYFFYILEAGFKSQYDSANGPLKGTYRVGLWNDPQPKANSDSIKNYRDDTGFYISCDQLVYKEKNEPEDAQGLGIFCRYGWADAQKNDLSNFWSAGFQYQGLFEGRDDDIFAAAFGQGFFSDSASSSYTADYESAIECYYSARIAPWLYVSPNIQYVKNPGGSDSVGDAVVLGVRVLAIF
jgi:porin